MSKKKIPVTGIVYSTDPNYSPEFENRQEPATISPAAQQLRVRLETKHRAGKAVTLIEGFIGTTPDATLLHKNLKNFCGTGGTVKDGEILIQGDQRDKVIQWLLKNGYGRSRKL